MGTKRARIDVSGLLKVVNSGGVTRSSLRRVVASLTDAKLSTRQVDVATHHRFAQVRHTMRLPKVDGGEVAIDVCDPKALLALVLRENTIVRHWYEEAWRVCPSSQSSPWNLLAGWDEFAPWQQDGAG